MFNVDDGAERFKPSDVLYDRTCPDAATPREWNPGMSHPSQQGANAEEAGAKTVDQFVWGGLSR